jgi:5-methylcytosine-specific restriction endonuclease McrA
VRPSRAGDEKARAYNRAWYAAHRDYFPAYRAAHPEKVAREREATREWKARNADHVREYQRAYRQAHRVRFRMYQQRRDALKVSQSVGTVTDADVVRLVRRFDHRCAYCGAQWEQLDHVIPISRGGAHSIGNLLPACGRCNRSKKDRLLIEWKRG